MIVMSKDELTTALGGEERQQLIGCSYIDGLSKLPLSSPLPGEVIGVEGPQKEQVLIFAPDLFIPSLEEVTTKLKATDCSSLSPLPPSHLMKGQPCAAIFSEDSTLYRAMVSSTPSKDQVEVSFVDYGNSEVKAIDEVLTLPPELLSTAPAIVEVPLCRQLAREAEEVEEELLGSAELVLIEIPGRGIIGKVYKEGRELLVKRVRLEDVPGCLSPDMPVGERLRVNLSFVENVRKVWLTRHTDQANKDKVANFLFVVKLITFFIATKTHP